MSLAKYKSKRNFTKTSEPSSGRKSGNGKALKFVIQRHNASRLHYDFRLEMDGALKSWAVPKGPSLNPKDKRLAMMVEDHPLAYGSFEGVIPKGNYGAGTVEIWDSGTYEEATEHAKVAGEKKLLKDLKEGSIKFVLHGDKLHGRFALVKLKNGRQENAWLLIKDRDEYAVNKNYDSEKQPSATGEKIAHSIKRTDGKIRPMLCKTVEQPFSKEGWLFEIKWDGYRAIAEIHKNKRSLYSRNGLSFNDSFPTVFNALKDIKDDMILDGEIVAFDEEGRPSFQLLQHHKGDKELSLAYYVFDILSYDGKPMIQLTLEERKKFLKEVLPVSNIIRYSDHIKENGKRFFEEAKKKNLEGIIAKRADSIYEPDVRTGNWLKIKNQNTEEVVIAGYTAPRGNRKHFGALILGEYKNGKLIYSGHTGTGFDDVLLKELSAKMQKLVMEKSPFANAVKTNMPVTWIKPKLVANIKYTEKTKEGIFRHPVFMGLRVDKTATSMKKSSVTASKPAAKKAVKAAAKKKTPAAKKSSVEKDAAAAPVKEKKTLKKGSKLVTIDNIQLELTNTQKIFWDDLKITKEDVINYYDKIFDYIIPYLKDRPESMKRMPNGIKDEGFFQKDMKGLAPGWADTVKLYSESVQKDIEYFICNNKAALVYMANLGCIEINPWNSRLKKINNPDYLIIDIDPSEKNDFEDVIEVAKAVKEVLNEGGAVGYPKTSGASGMHVYVPLGAKYDYDHARMFAELVAHLTVEKLPDLTTTERSLSKRAKDKIYVDYLQNRKGQTLAAAYSLRPKPGATVSTPLEWSEVKTGLHPSTFDIKTIFKRIEKKGDLFKPVLGKGIDMQRCLKKLNAG